MTLSRHQTRFLGRVQVSFLYVYALWTADRHWLILHHVLYKYVYRSMQVEQADVQRFMPYGNMLRLWFHAI